MKNITLFILIFSFTILHSFAQTIHSRDLYFLIDVTDQQLFNIIQEDIQSNFGTFMQNTRFGEIKENDRLSFHVSPIGATENLELKSASISGPSNKLSGQAQRKLVNPKPLLTLLNTELTNYEKLSTSQIKETSITNILLKTLLEANPEGENYILVFSDLIENNKYLNHYKRIPEGKEFSKIIQTSIDPYVMTKLQKKLDEGMEVRIILVHKDLINAKVDARKIKIYWQKLLSELGITDVQFIDNLSNTIEL